MRSQIPVQRPMPTKMLVRISMLQVVSLIVEALIMIVVLNIQNGLIACSSITLISPLITIIFLPKLFFLGGGGTIIRQQQQHSRTD